MHCSQIDFRRPDHVKLLSAVLKSSALNFWTENVDGRAEFTELDGVFRKLEAQSDIPALQKQTEALVNAMNVGVTMKKHSRSRIAAPGLLYHKVARLNEHLPNVKQRNAFRIPTFMKTVKRYEWFREFEEEILQDKRSYYTLYTKLSPSIDIWVNESTQQNRDPEQADDRQITSVKSSYLTYF